ncbi:hypothetical protein RI570_20205 [Brucella pseudogrignonensis]|uniref:hypothetical protein n=1 Tax=Brucella pseudogrignonensis TaxID=419475 RepID=UPI0028B43FC3|nr:hypothetical protein [Brucella pseudogrignonensis]MDT6942388.1 hypothetical protein [Brucella pseudogrignonensis]
MKIRIIASVIISASLLSSGAIAQRTPSVTFGFGEVIEPKKHDVDYDIIGIKIGMTPAEVKEKLKELYAESSIEEIKVHFGNQEIQSEPFIDEISADTYQEGRTKVYFTTPKLGNRVKYVERHIVFNPEKPRPDVSHLNKITAEKYGIVEDSVEGQYNLGQFWSSNNCKAEKSSSEIRLPEDNCDAAVASNIYFHSGNKNDKATFLNLKMRDVANSKLDNDEKQKLFENELNKHRQNQGDTKF